MPTNDRPGVINAGEDTLIQCVNLTAKTTGAMMDVTNWECHGVARALYERYVLGRPVWARTWRYRMLMPIVAYWDYPQTIFDDEHAEIITGGATPNMVQLHVTPSQSNGWRCPLVLVQAELINPITGEISRILDQQYDVDFSAVPYPPGSQ